MKPARRRKAALFSLAKDMVRLFGNLPTSRERRKSYLLATALVDQKYDDLCLSFDESITRGTADRNVLDI